MSVGQLRDHVAGLGHRGDREDERGRLTDESLELRYYLNAVAVPGGHIEQVEGLKSTELTRNTTPVTGSRDPEQAVELSGADLFRITRSG